MLCTEVCHVFVITIVIKFFVTIVSISEASGS